MSTCKSILINDNNFRLSKENHIYSFAGIQIFNIEYALKVNDL